MNNFRAGVWAEVLKMRRSKVPLFSALGFSMAPLMGGLFMIILKDPEAAKAMGLISAKAQLLAGVADYRPSSISLREVAVAGNCLGIVGSLFGQTTDRTRRNPRSPHLARSILPR
jgi:ABC-2 type transport system permease protein